MSDSSAAGVRLLVVGGEPSAAMVEAKRLIGGDPNWLPADLAALSTEYYAVVKRRHPDDP